MSLECKALVLNLEKEISPSEDVVVCPCCLPSGRVLHCHEVLAEFSGQAARQSDQSPCMISQEFLADARLVIHAMQRCLGGDLYQIAIPLIRLGQN